MLRGDVGLSDDFNISGMRGGTFGSSGASAGVDGERRSRDWGRSRGGGSSRLVRMRSVMVTGSGSVTSRVLIASVILSALNLVLVSLFGLDPSDCLSELVTLHWRPSFESTVLEDVVQEHQCAYVLHLSYTIDGH